MNLLSFNDVQAFYGRAQALFGATFHIDGGEVVALLGRNGMGRSTTIKCIAGLLAAAAGEIRFGGVSTRRLPPHKIARLGIGLVPEGRQVFPNLTVFENLVATARTSASSGGTAQWTLERVYALFPRLQERAGHLGWQLSGGEQQMLAIGRALLTNPRLLILDEATEGLAPLIRQEIWSALRQLKKSGMAILVVDKNLAEVATIADRHYVIEKGRMVWDGTSAELELQKDHVHQLVTV